MRSQAFLFFVASRLPTRQLRVIIFVTTSQQTGLDTRSKAKGPDKTTEGDIALESSQESLDMWQ